MRGCVLFLLSVQLFKSAAFGCAKYLPSEMRPAFTFGETTHTTRACNDCDVQLSGPSLCELAERTT